MLKQIKSLRPADTVPRVIADLAMVHFAAIASLLMTLTIHILKETVVSREVLVEILKQEYLNQAVVLTVCFPVCFIALGFYSDARAFAMRYKWWHLFRGCVMASLIYIAVSKLLNTSGMMPRSSLLVLPVLLSVGVVGIRILNLWLERIHLNRLPARPVLVGEGRETVLVVGGAGYIGSLVVRKLLARGMRVRLLDNLTYGAGAIHEIMSHPGLEFVKGDCRNIQDVVKAMSGVDDVIHLAAIVGDPACAVDGQNAFQINYAATRMMLEVARGYGIKRFLFASSCSVYGATDYTVDERGATVPISLYAETKLNSEKVLLEAASEKFHPVVLRFATVFGLAPRPRFDLVVNLLTARAFSDGVITIYNGEQWRPFIHVDDVAEAVCSVLRAPLAMVSGQIFNVGDDRLNYTLTQVAESIKEEFGDTKIEYVENADRRNYRVSFRKIREQVGFHCSKSLKDGIREIRAAFEAGKLESYADPLYSNVSYVKAYGSLNPAKELDVKVMAAFCDEVNNAQGKAPFRAAQPAG